MRFNKIIYFFLFSLCWGCSNRDHETSGHLDHLENISEAEQMEKLSPVFIEPSRLQLYGVTTEIAMKRDLIRSIRTVGIVTVDERKVFKIQTKFSGWIEKLYVDFVNKPVLLGEPLFTIYSPELYATQEEYLLALKSSKIPPEGVFSRELSLSNDALLKASKERLELWDIPEDEIQRLHLSKTPSYALTIRSPVNGIVLGKQAFYGQNTGTGIDLFTVADLSWVWVLADIYEQDISLIKLGDEVDFTITAFPTMHFKGSVSFINYVLDPKTRTVKARIDVDNQQYLLKPNMYGVAELKVNMGKSLAIPQDAVIDTGLRKIIFIDEGKGHFTPREVDLGYLAEGYFQVLAGIEEGERVVTSSQFLLDSESRIGGIGNGNANCIRKKYDPKNH